MDIAKLEFVPIAGHLGAEVRNIRLDRPLGADAVAAVQQGLSRFKVLFFPEQWLSHEQQTALAQQFGTLAKSHPWISVVAGHPAVHPLVTGRSTIVGLQAAHRARWRRPAALSGWHADLTAVVNPPKFNILRADSVTSRGGDTIWADMVAAYENLSDPLRRLVDGLTALHRYGVGYVPYGGVQDEYSERVRSVALASCHPVVRVVPETDKRALFVNPSFTSHIEEVSPAESAHLLALLFEHATRTEFTVRYRWRLVILLFGTIAPRSMPHPRIMNTSVRNA